MSTGPGSGREPLDELQFALAQGGAVRPPAALRRRVLEAASTARVPGVSIGTEAPVPAVEAYRRTMASFDAVLSQLTDAHWHTHALRDLDVQGLLGHLIGVEHQLHAALGLAPEIVVGTDHVTSTQPDALAQAGRPPADTLAEWRALVGRTVEYGTGLDSAGNEQLLTLHTFTIPFERMLVVRLFETWTHEEDVRRAVGLPLAAPDSARLRLMTDLAISALPAGLARIGRPQPGRTARMVLTGPGGGTWQASLDRGTEPGQTNVRIVADAVLFCRLVANRVAISDVAVDISGDRALGADLLAGAQALALD